MLGRDDAVVEVVGVEALDGAAIIIPSAVVLVVAAASCYLPARRAAAIEPAEVLVSELRIRPSALHAVGES